VQRASGAPQIRDRFELRVSKDPGSAAQHFMLRCARDTPASIHRQFGDLAVLGAALGVILADIAH
jgi:hypothetical protein